MKCQKILNTNAKIYIFCFLFPFSISLFFSPVLFYFICSHTFILSIRTNLAPSAHRSQVAGRAPLRSAAHAPCKLATGRRCRAATATPSSLSLSAVSHRRAAVASAPFSLRCCCLHPFFSLHPPATVRAPPAPLKLLLQLAAPMPRNVRSSRSSFVPPSAVHPHPSPGQTLPSCPISRLRRCGHHWPQLHLSRRRSLRMSVAEVSRWRSPLRSLWHRSTPLNPITDCEHDAPLPSPSLIPVVLNLIPPLSVLVMCLDSQRKEELMSVGEKISALGSELRAAVSC
jgi:hypothetical protein